MMQTRNESLSHKVDWVTVLLYGVLVFWGWLNIFSVTFDHTVAQNIFDPGLNSGRQLIFIVASVFVILAILIIDMRFWETFAYIIFGVVLFVLMLVPIIGKEVGGNKAWIGFGSFGLQPSEFAKFATALVIAKLVGSIGFKIDNLRNQIILF